MCMKRETLEISSEEDIVRIRHNTRTLALEIGLGLVEQTKVVTAASELARNTYKFGGGGTVIMELIRQGARVGLRLTFEDQGPGIPDLEAAMSDGYSTGNGLGLGLSGSKRLVNEFEIFSEPGRGTRVSVTKWK